LRRGFGPAALALCVGAGAGVIATPSTARAADLTGPTLVGDGWSPGERAAIAAAVARLPAAILPAAPRWIARDATGCDGDGWPADSRLVDARGDLHLCPPGAPAAPEAVARQIATALVFAFDQTARWSEDPAWRRINGWRARVTAGFAPRAENVGPGGFAAPRGQRSPRWDLSTFIAKAWLDAPPHATGVDCGLLAQTTFTRRHLGLPAARCASFEAWADLDRLADVELTLAAPSTAMIGSLFGHLFLRLVYRDESGETPVHLSRTIAFLADNDVPFAADPGYAVKGIAGFYTASLHERVFLDSYREYVVVEGRDLRRWRVSLSADERRALLEQLWTTLDGPRFTYYFFRQNCATLLLDLFEGVLAAGETIGRPGFLAAPPASTLERWASAKDMLGQPRITFVPDPIMSFDHRARLASRRRVELERRLGTGLSEADRSALQDALQGARAGASEVRAAAYQRAGTLLAPAGAGAAADVHAWLRDSATIESHLSVVANLQAEARADVERRRQVDATAKDIAAELGHVPELAGVVGALEAGDPDVRLGGYRALHDLIVAGGQAPERVARLRLYALLRSESRYDVGRMKRVPGLRDALLFVALDKPIVEQPYLAGREGLLRLPIETRVSPPLASLQRAKQALFAARALAPAASEEASARGDATLSARADYDASLPRSGIDQLAVLAAVIPNGTSPTSARGALVLAGALYDEQLGDHHRFGFPSDTGFVVARSAVAFQLGAGLPAWATYQARAFGYRSLRLPLPEAGGHRRTLGWEMHADVAGSRARALAAEIDVGWGVLAPLADRRELRDHALVGVGLSYRAFFPAAGAVTRTYPQAIAAPFVLELRAGLGAEPRYRSWLAARLWAQPMAVLIANPDRFAFETGATVDVHLALGARAGSAHDPALLLRAQVLRTTLAFTGTGPATEAMFAAGVELR
jgi:hypothetical protein